MIGKTRLVRQQGQPTTLTGKVKLLAEGAGGLLSNNGGRLVSDQGSGIISNNSGAIISDNGSGLVNKTRYALTASDPAPAGEFALAEAVIRLTDATGAQLVDEHDRPLTATSRPDGSYTLSAVLPAGNLVLRVALHQGGALAGGELAALLARPAGPAVSQAIDTATSLGAAYAIHFTVRVHHNSEDTVRSHQISIPAI